MTTRRPDRKQQIVSEAYLLFSQHGYDRVTIKQLADACGITEPALYRHFESKQDIYAAALDTIRKRLEHHDLFDRLAKSDDIEELFRELASHIVSFFGEDESVYRMLLFAALDRHSKAKAVYQTIRGTYVSFLKSQLDRLYKAGLIVQKHNEITARCFIGMVFDCALSTTLWKGMQGQVFKPINVITNNVPIYVRGLKK